MDRQSLIRIVNLYKQYETEAGVYPVLKDISLTIDAGEFVAIMGPSGSGKSTFMNILGCLDTPTSGHYYLSNQDVGAMSAAQLAHLRNQVIGFVFQGYNLLQRLTSLDNVALPLLYMGVAKSERSRRALALLKSVGLDPFAQSLPNQLSGGQQQRVAIARAIANNPRLILADEPTGNLDTRTSYEIMQIFQRLNEEEHITIVLVTHEPDIARYAKRLVHFRDGRIESDAPVTTPASAQVPP